MERSSTKCAAVILAGGRSADQQSGPDVALLPLAGRRLLSRAVASLTYDTGVRHVVIAVHDDDHDAAAEAIRREVGDISHEFVPAGLSAEQSFARGLEALAEPITRGEYAMVMLHDAAFPMVAPHLVRDVLRAAERWGAAVPYLGLDDFVWINRMGAPLRFSGKDQVRIQMPQTFRAGELLDAYRDAAAEGFLTGTAIEAIERYCGRRVRGVPGDTRNVEIRSPHDLLAAEGLLAALHYVVT